jgi:hypothetical protein
VKKNSRAEDLMWLWVFPVALILGALISLAWVNGRAEREAAIALHPAQAQALIVRVDAEVAGSKSTSVQYTPTVQFVLADGTVFTTQLDSDFTAGIYMAGDRVAVMYDAQQPARVIATARKGDYLYSGAWAWAVLGLGVVGAGFATWGTIAYPKPKAPKSETKRPKRP